MYCVPNSESPLREVPLYMYHNDIIGRGTGILTCNINTDYSDVDCGGHPQYLQGFTPQ